MFEPQPGKAEAAKSGESGSGLDLWISLALQASKDDKAALATAWVAVRDAALGRLQVPIPLLPQTTVRDSGTKDRSTSERKLISL
jgi:hypothetical protein